MFTVLIPNSGQQRFIFKSHYPILTLPSTDNTSSVVCTVYIIVLTCHVQLIEIRQPPRNVQQHPFNHSESLGNLKMSKVFP